PTVEKDVAVSEFAVDRVIDVTHGSDIWLPLRTTGHDQGERKEQQSLFHHQLLKNESNIQPHALHGADGKVIQTEPRPTTQAAASRRAAGLRSSPVRHPPSGIRRSRHTAHRAHTPCADRYAAFRSAHIRRPAPARRAEEPAKEPPPRHPATSPPRAANHQPAPRSARSGPDRSRKENQARVCPAICRPPRSEDGRRPKYAVSWPW